MPIFRDILYTLRHSTEMAIYRDFLSDHYQRHNVARLGHLASLNLAIDGKRVLEVGAGIGDHTLFYLYRGCTVLPTDGRPENVEFIRKRLGIPAEVLDAERNAEQMRNFGRFDILHCYGFLYHISNPEVFFARAAESAQTLLLETCASYGDEPLKNPVTERADYLCQALHGAGCRPTRRWLFDELRKNYAHVYCPRTQPRHAEFPRNWKEPPADARGLTRAVFIASHTSIENAKLTAELPAVYDE